MTVTHGAFSADKSQIFPPVNHAAGETLVVKIAARDRWSNAYAARDVAFSATVTPQGGGSTFTSSSLSPTGAAMDDDGRFVVAFPPGSTAAVGRYDVDVFHSPGGARVGSRTSLNVVAGNAVGNEFENQTVRIVLRHARRQLDRHVRPGHRREGREG